MLKPLSRSLVCLSVLLLSAGAGAQSTASSLLTLPERTVLPGEMALVPLALQAPNLGVGAECERAFVRLELPQDWTALLPQNGLCYAGEVRELLTIKTPDTVAAGVYRIPGTLTLPGGNTVPLELTVTVRAVGDFSLSLPTDFAVFPQAALTFEAVLINEGTSPDVFTLELLGGESLEKREIALEAGGRAVIPVRFVPRGTGNSALLRLNATSRNTPVLTKQAVVRLGPAPLESAGLGGLNRNQLSFGVGLSASADVLRLERGLALEASGSVSGRLSDDISLSGLIRLSADPVQGRYEDALSLGLQGDVWQTVFSASVFKRSLGLVGRTLRDRNNYELSLSLNDWNTGQTSLSFTARPDSRFSIRADQQFPGYNGRGNLESGLRVDYSLPEFAGLRPHLGAEVRYSATPQEKLSFIFDEGLNYQNEHLTASQSYRFRLPENDHTLSALLKNRPKANDPLNVELGASLKATPTSTEYAINAAASYAVTDALQTGVQAGLTERTSQAAWTVQYRPSFSWGELSAANTLSVSDKGLTDRYSFGVSSRINRFSVQAFAQGDLEGFKSAGGRLGYNDSGFQLGTSYDVSYVRNKWVDTLTVGAAYQLSDYRFDAGYQVRDLAGEAFQSFNAGLRVQVLPDLGVQAVYTNNTRGDQSLRVGANLALRGSIATPEALEELFGGTKAGRIEVYTFLDRNRNGFADAGEPPLFTEVLVGGRLVRTNDQGRFEVPAAQGQYALQLGPTVSAQYRINGDFVARVSERQTTRVELPIVETATLQGRLFVDRNADGRRDSGDSLAANLSLTVMGDGFNRRLLSDASGYFRLDGLVPGRYSLKPSENARLLPAETVEVTLEAGRSNEIELGVRLKPTETTQSTRLAQLGLSVQLPVGILPIGATVLFEAQTEQVVSRVSVDLGSRILELSSTDGRTWSSRVALPKELQGLIPVRIYATNEAGAIEERQDFLQTDEGVAQSRVTFGPRTALPGQILTFDLQTYQNPQSVGLRLSDGRMIPLQASGTYQYSGRLQAERTPGTYTFTLTVDGVDRETYTYKVIALAEGETSPEVEGAPSPEAEDTSELGNMAMIE